MSKSKDKSSIPNWMLNLKDVRKNRTPREYDENVQNDIIIIDELNELNEPSSDDSLVFSKYLKEWQQKHNAEVSNPSSETAILFDDVWQQRADDILKSEKIDESQYQTVQLTISKDENGENVDLSDDNKTSNLQPADDIFAENNNTHKETVSYTVKVINPPVDAEQNVALMDETLVLKQLTEKLRPHLSDAIAGLVRTTTQKYMSVLSRELQHELHNEINDIVKDTLHLHLNQVLDEIKSNAGIKKKLD